MLFVPSLILAASIAAVPSPAPKPQLPAVPAVAPGYAAPKISQPPPQVIGVTQQPFVGITLENAIGMALARNPDLAIAQANRRISAYQIQAARGAYDVNLSVLPQYQYSKQAPQNAFFASPNFGPIVQQTTSINGGAQGTLRGGQQYDVTLAGRKVNDNTTINTFDPYYPTIFSVNFAQPLGRGRSTNQAVHQLQLAQINQAATNAQTLSTVSSTIAGVQNAYWDLVSAWRSVAIQEEALKDVIAQQHSNVRLARAGASAPVDVVQVNSQIAVFQQNVFQALQNVALLQNQLKSQLVDNPADPIWTANLVPTSPVLELPTQPSLSALVTQALGNRPEIAQLRSQLQVAAENLAYAQNQVKPQVDLKLGYTSNGFAGQVIPPGSFFQSSAEQVVAIDQLIAAVNRTLPPAQQIPALPAANTPVPAYLAGGLDRSIKNLLSNRFPVYTAGVQVNFPVGNNAAKGNLGVALEQQRIAQLQEASTIQRITADVRNALQAYSSSIAQLEAARAARQASQEVLASELRRFRAGASTTFLVLQREIELADNRGRELQAQTNLNKAVVQLQQATGTILSTNNVNITTVGEGSSNQ
ncbi:MAG: TolC family protein [Candidatus Baltobacteraceae bacterium]